MNEKQEQKENINTIPESFFEETHLETRLSHTLTRNQLRNVYLDEEAIVDKEDEVHQWTKKVKHEEKVTGKKAVFSDQSKFNFYGSAGMQYACRQISEKYHSDCIRGTVQYPPGQKVQNYLEEYYNSLNLAWE